MRIFIKYFFLFAVILLLTECKPPVYQKTTTSSIQLDSNTTQNKDLVNLIKPYKTKLDTEMNEVLVISADEFPKEKGKPETKLGNFVADLSFKIGNELYQPADGDSIDFCLLNFGGLRTSLPKGPITRGKIFELMPFENELVIVTLTHDSTSSLIDYLIEKRGQPVSGIKTGIDEFGDTQTQLGNPHKIKTKYKVLTSDYLANGGDNMNFFLNPIKIEPLNIKLRDAIIQHCISENKKGKQLVGKLDGRITFE